MSTAAIVVLLLVGILLFGHSLGEMRGRQDEALRREERRHLPPELWEDY